MEMVDIPFEAHTKTIARRVTVVAAGRVRAGLYIFELMYERLTPGRACQMQRGVRLPADFLYIPIFRKVVPARA